LGYYETIYGYDNLCMPFVRGFVLLLVVFLTLYIFIVGGIGCACICGLVVDWERLYFGLVC